MASSFTTSEIDLQATVLYHLDGLCNIVCFSGCVMWPFLAPVNNVMLIYC